MFDQILKQGSDWGIRLTSSTDIAVGSSFVCVIVFEDLTELEVEGVIVGRTVTFTQTGSITEDWAISDLHKYQITQVFSATSRIPRCNGKLSVIPYVGTIPT